MKEGVTLTQQEQKRLIVLNGVERGQLNAEEAAAVLELSIRQIRRLRAAYREEGAAALMHGNRGRRPVNALDERIREQVSELGRERYADCNHAHLTDLLTQREGLPLSRSTIRRLLMEGGIASPRTRRAPRHHKRRDRYAQHGMLLQIDGSRHDWLEGRGPCLTLIAAIDDANGGVDGAVFRDQEDAAGYLLLLDQLISAQGIPIAVYHASPVSSAFRSRHGEPQHPRNCRRDRDAGWLDHAVNSPSPGATVKPVLDRHPKHSRLWHRVPSAWRAM